MRSRFYRRNGTPYPNTPEGLHEWARDFENINIKRVAQDTLLNGIRVSTIWLGLNHRYDGGRPLIFESMSFVPQHTKAEIWGKTFEWIEEPIGEQLRYATEEEAILGHKMLVKKFKTYKSADQLMTEIKK